MSNVFDNNAFVGLRKVIKLWAPSLTPSYFISGEWNPESPLTHDAYLKEAREYVQGIARHHSSGSHEALVIAAAITAAIIAAESTLT